MIEDIEEYLKSCDIRYTDWTSDKDPYIWLLQGAYEHAENKHDYWPYGEQIYRDIEEFSSNGGLVTSYKKDPGKALENFINKFIKPEDHEAVEYWLLLKQIDS